MKKGDKIILEGKIECWQEHRGWHAEFPSILWTIYSLDNNGSQEGIWITSRGWGEPLFDSCKFTDYNGRLFIPKYEFSKVRELGEILI